MNQRAPRLADPDFEPTDEQLDEIARKALCVANARYALAMASFYASIREHAAAASASLAYPPAAPRTNRQRSRR